MIAQRILRTAGAAAVAAVVLLLTSATAFAQTIRYNVSMPKPASHIYNIEMTIGQAGVPSIDLSLPAWNALYQVRDFAQYVQNLSANVPYKRVSKDTWRFAVGNSEQLTVRYGVYANESGAFSSQLDSSHAFF